MIRSWFLGGVAAASLLFGVNAGAGAAEKITFMIDWLPSGDKAVPYLGVQKGLFAAEGLEVAIQSGRGSSDVVTRLGTATADIGTGGLSALLQAKGENKVPVKAVIRSTPSSRTRSSPPKARASPRSRTWPARRSPPRPSRSSNVTWPLLLQANGIDPAKVDLLKADPGALAPMLATGRVAATINWTTVAPGFVKPLAETGKKIKIIPWSEFGYEGYGLSVFVSEKMLAERPEAVKKFLRAYAKATDLAIADPKAAAAALKTMVPEIDEAVAEQQFAASVPLMVNDIAKANGAGASRRRCSPRPGSGPPRRRTCRSTSSIPRPRSTARCCP